MRSHLRVVCLKTNWLLRMPASVVSGSLRQRKLGAETRIWDLQAKSSIFVSISTDFVPQVTKTDGVGLCSCLSCREAGNSALKDLRGVLWQKRKPRQATRCSLI